MSVSRTSGSVRASGSVCEPVVSCNLQENVGMENPMDPPRSCDSPTPPSRKARFPGERSRLPELNPIAHTRKPRKAPTDRRSAHEAPKGAGKPQGAAGGPRGSRRSKRPQNPIHPTPTTHPPATMHQTQFWLGGQHGWGPKIFLKWGILKVAPPVYRVVAL